MADSILERESKGDRSFLQRNGRKLVAVALWALLLAALYGYMRANELSPTGLLRALLELLQGPIGPLLYIGLYTLRPLTFFSAAVLTLLAGALFGPLLGILYTIIGGNLSAAVAYGMGRVLGEGLLDNGATEGLVQEYAGRMRDNSFETILVMRFLFLPYDLVSYLAGFLRIDLRAFVLATALGSIPGTISVVLAGASLQLDQILNGGARPSFSPWTLALAAGMFAASIGLSRYMKRREEKRATGDQFQGASHARAE